MSDLVPELRRVAEWLHSWDPDEGRLHTQAADRIEALEAEVERLTKAEAFAIRMWERTQKDASGLIEERERLRADLATAQRERDEARAALADAIECVESWGEYATEYFRVKHDLDGDLARLRAALPTPPEEADRAE